MITVAHGSSITQFITVERGVFQGDPCSPLLFNICFNPLIQSIIQSKLIHRGYMWGPNANLLSRSWLQFADDTVIISDCVKSAQSLLDLNMAWCNWAEMKIRIDKCCTFGMRKQSGSYIQFQPNLNVGDSSIPALEDGANFKYLGKIFDFLMNNSEIKNTLEHRLTSLLQTTSELKIKPIHSISDEFRSAYVQYFVYLDNSTQALDAKICNSVREWLELPISACVAETLSLPKAQGGMGIPSMKETAAKLWLDQWFKFHSSKDDESRALFKSTSGHNSAVDGFIKSNTYRTTAVKERSEERSRSSFSHIISLKSQGKVIAAINEHLNRSAITRWTKEINKLAGMLFNFARKALIQQLPTAANLFRWGKATDPLCPLCKTFSQTNEHVISNCSSPVALERCKRRHDDVLTILVDAIIHGSKPSLKIFADLNDPRYNQLSSLFNSLRPDIAILGQNSIDKLELTICHEMNLEKSKQYKATKYVNLQADIKTY